MTFRYRKPNSLTLIFLTLILSTSICQAVVINEIRIDQAGADTDEYFELYGSAGESLADLSYLVIGDQGSNQGYIEAVVNLSGYSIAADGLFLTAETSFSLSTNVDLIAALNFENNDNVTHMLVRNFSGSLHDDIDSNDDGIIDTHLWDTIVDSIALLATSTGGDLVYSNNLVSPQSGTSAPHIFRAVDGSGAWQAGTAIAGISDSPHLLQNANHVISVPEPASLMLMLPGTLLALRIGRNKTAIG